MNGFMLGTWLWSALQADSKRQLAARAGRFSLAHNVSAAADVQPTLDRLVSFGGKLLRAADPDDHTWEIAYNRAWPISPEGYVIFGS